MTSGLSGAALLYIIDIMDLEKCIAKHNGLG